MEPGKIKINREILKTVAAACMLIDHIAFGFVAESTALYTLMRLVGWMAMPLYAFMIAEGLCYTRSKWKYAGRVALTALIAVMPYNLYILGGLWKWRPNVLFTYALAMVAVIAIDSASRNFVKVIIGIAACAVAMLLNFEFTFIPVVIILIIYYFRGYVPIVTYKKQDGFSLPGIFWYAFYPVHLAVLYAIYVIYTGTLG